MSSYRSIYYHLDFRTKGSLKTLPLQNSQELYSYIAGFIRNKNCYLYQINGMENHIHILCDLHPSIALADFIRDMKTASSLWLKKSGNFRDFTGWADGYAALTYAAKDKAMITDYIANQRMHHKNESFEDELTRFLVEQGIEIDERFFP